MERGGVEADEISQGSVATFICWVDYVKSSDQINDNKAAAVHPFSPP